MGVRGVDLIAWKHVARNPEAQRCANAAQGKAPQSFPLYSKWAIWRPTLPFSNGTEEGGGGGGEKKKEKLKEKTGFNFWSGVQSDRFWRVW